MPLSTSAPDGSLHVIVKPNEAQVELSLTANPNAEPFLLNNPLLSDVVSIEGWDGFSLLILMNSGEIATLNLHTEACIIFTVLSALSPPPHTGPSGARADLCIRNPGDFRSVFLNWAGSAPVPKQSRNISKAAVT